MKAQSAAALTGAKINGPSLTEDTTNPIIDIESITKEQAERAEIAIREIQRLCKDYFGVEGELQTLTADHPKSSLRNDVKKNRLRQKCELLTQPFLVIPYEQAKTYDDGRLKACLAYLAIGYLGHLSPATNYSQTRNKRLLGLNSGSQCLLTALVVLSCYKCAFGGIFAFT